MASTVLEAAGSLRAAVVCDDDDVRAWAEAQGAEAIWTPGLGLNGAVVAGVAHLARRGVDRVVVAHADLPLATDLAWLADTDGVTLVPDRHRDGTNVACVPATAGFSFAYGAGSFAAHRAEASAPRPRASASSPTPRSAGTSTWPADLAPPAELDPPPYLALAGAVSLNLPTPAVALAIGAHPDDVEFGVRRHAGQVVGRRHRGAPPDLHRRLEGQLGSVDGHRRARRHPPGRAAGRGPGARRHRRVRVPRLARRRARVGSAPAVGGRVLDPPARSRPWCSATIRGSATGCTPTTATPGSSRSRASWRHATRTSSPSRRSPTTVPRPLLLFEADEPDHVEDVTGFADAKLAALHAHTSQLLSTMGIDESATADRDRAPAPGLRRAHRRPPGRARRPRGRHPRRGLQAHGRPVATLPQGQGRDDSGASSMGVVRRPTPTAHQRTTPGRETLRAHSADGRTGTHDAVNDVLS